MSKGGFIVPEVAYVYRPRRGIFFSLIRWIGMKMVAFGGSIIQLGNYKKEIKPLDSYRYIKRKMLRYYES